MESSSRKLLPVMKKVEVSTAEQIEFFKKRLTELEEQHAEEEALRVQEEVDLLQKIAAMGYTITTKEVPTVATETNSIGNGNAGLEYANQVELAKETTQNTEESDTEELNWVGMIKNFFTGKGGRVSSNAGLTAMLATLAVIIAGFAWYPVIFEGNLNDSEVRIHNAATLHFISHVWMGMAVLLLGFGFQYLAFNQHFRYLWSNIKTKFSATADFDMADESSKTRLYIAIFTYAFPVYIFTQMFQFILG